jgi:hypothetical protein
MDPAGEDPWQVRAETWMVKLEGSIARRVKPLYTALVDEHVEVMAVPSTERVASPQQDALLIHSGNCRTRSDA